jgi:multidrug resistance efflux pump
VIARVLALSLKVLATLAVVAVALFGARSLWIHYDVEPWTRDGKIRADVAEISTDVNALVLEVRVHDNQSVAKGDVLLVLDRSRYDLAVRQSDAAIAATEASLAQAIRENRRNDALGDLVTREQREQGAARVAALRAELEGARAQRDTAALNASRTVVRSPVNGIATNVDVQPGDYASVGRQVLAVVNSDSFRVDGYFEETKVALIRAGDRAVVRIMGVGSDIEGTVESIAAGIEDRERGPSSNGLANINPTFSWVRLAQRIPVRIRLTGVPADIRLIAGRTATVSVRTPPGRKREGDR